VAYGLAYGLGFVRPEIIHDHDVAGFKRGDQDPFDINEEAFAVDRPVEEPWGIDPILAERGEESRGVPMAKRCLVDQALTGLGPSPGRNSTPNDSRSSRHFQPIRREARAG